MLSYWAASGWDPDSGMSTLETLAELGLEKHLDYKGASLIIQV